MRYDILPNAAVSFFFLQCPIIFGSCPDLVNHLQEVSEGIGPNTTITATRETTTSEAISFIVESRETTRQEQSSRDNTSLLLLLAQLRASY
jgi:hypothetical protein